MKSYEVLASFYDRFNEQIDYTAWADKIVSFFDAFGIKKDAIILDAACGTGKMTIELAKRGYDMIGTDLSAEMLMQARISADEAGVSPLFLLQDLTSLDLYGTVMAITCCLDSLNYLTKEKELEKFFSLAHNYIEPNGLLVFDMNSEYKFKNSYGDNCYVMQDDEVFLSWQNFYDENTRNCQFVLDFFIKDKNGRYQRKKEEQTEHCFEHGRVLELLENNGFELVDISCDFYKGGDVQKCDRIHYVCKRI